MKSVKIFSPASVANVGPGYDTFGFAIDGLGDVITLTARDDEQLHILPAEGADLPTDPKNNVATVAIQALLDHLGSKQGMDIHIKKLFKPGSGLGSSASSASGAVFAANELLGRPLAVEALLPFALEGEALASKSYHADNVAPALLGGFQAVRSYDPLELFCIPTPENLSVLIIFPDVQVKTAEAKGLVPKELSVAEAREQWGNIGALIHAMHTSDYDLMRSAITDRIAEPVRKKLIPAYDTVKKAVMEKGAVGFNISGSGPSMFALFKNAEDAQGCQSSIKEIYEKQDLNVLLHLSQINPTGCKVL
ncbi:homoserine kinase [Marinoscillum furvescens]|uniref:Homoserine kinase n=1 Tax=Marinoscillum furvescens DSM 4134 TaxID=1122208 RepID=A0A3D9L5T6_MARFU|nr:homoserine kinase [Marinoscillum furvescens]REE01056.1 homoserine kinase [Marinoscillum furvescens DSM 4134]